MSTEEIAFFSVTSILAIALIGLLFGLARVKQ